MNSMRNFKYLFATVAIASLAVLGCSKDDKKGGEGQAQGEAKEGAAAAAAGAASALAVYPTETNFLLGIRVSEISTSNLYKQFVEPQIKAQADQEFAEFKAECGFDPMATIKEVIVGGVFDQNMEPQDDNMLITVKGISRTQMSECAEKMAKKEEQEVEVTQEGDFTKLVKDGETTWIAWLDDSTMIGSPEMEKAELEKLVSSKQGVSTNKAMMDLVGKADQQGGIWIAMQKPEGAQTPAEMDFESLFASIDLSKGLKVDAGIRQGSADEAKQTVAKATEALEQAKQSFGPLGKFLSKIELSAKETDVMINVSLSDQEMQELIQTAGPMMGAMMGGGF